MNKLFLFLIISLVACEENSSNLNNISPNLLDSAQVDFNADTFKMKCLARMDTVSLIELIQDCSYVLSNNHLDSVSRSKLLSLRGYFYNNEGLLALAYTDFKAAIRIAKNQKKAHKTMAYCVRSSVNLATRLGLFDQAMVYKNMALSVASKNDSIFILNNRAMIEQSYGTYDKAIQTLNLALSLNRSLSFRDTLMANKIGLFLKMDQLDSVKIILNDFEKRNPELANEFKLNLELHKANYLSLNGQSKIAIEKYKQVRLIAKELALFDKNMQLSVGIGLAKNWLLLDEFEKNHQYLNKTITNLLHESKPNLPPRFLELLKLNSLNLSNYDQATPTDVDQSIQHVLFVVKNMQQNRMHESEKTFLARYLKQIMESCYSYYATKKINLKGKYLQNFIKLSESVKAIRLRERLQLNRLGSSNEAFFVLQEKIDKVQLELSARDIDPVKEMNLGLELDDLKFNMAQLDRGILNSDTLISLLDSTVTNLIYFVGNQDVYYLFTDKNIAKVVKVNASIERLDHLVEKMTYALETRSDNYYNLSNELYHLLLPEASNQLAFKLVILPDQMLYQVPFEALVMTKSDTVQFVIHQHSIEYAYTSYAPPQEKNDEQEDLLSNNIFIHNSFKNSTEFSYIPLDKNPVSYLNDYQLELKTNKKGLKKTFIDALETQDLIHITSHGKFDDKRVMIFFEDSDTLTITDIEKQKCNTQLVMMNSCESALGEKDNIEGTHNFAYALHYAGCPNVSVNLWKSNSSTSQKILANFLSGLESTYLAESLRKSKLDFLRDEETSMEMSHPYYWASSVLYGRSKARASLQKKSNFIRNAIVISLLLLVPVIFNLRQH